MCDISFLVPNLVAFSCYTVNIHLEKWLMRCDTKRAIWWDLYNKYISIFCIKHMSNTFRTLQVNEWLSKKQTFFSFCEINATKFGTKIKFHLISFGLYHAVEIEHTILLLVFVAEKVLLLLVISLTGQLSPMPHLMFYVRYQLTDHISKGAPRWCPSSGNRRWLDNILGPLLLTWFNFNPSMDK